MEFKPPEHLSLTGNMGENLKKFKQKFEIFLIAANIEEKKEKKKSDDTVKCVGRWSVDVYNA